MPRDPEPEPVAGAAAAAAAHHMPRDSSDGSRQDGKQQQQQQQHIADGKAHDESNSTQDDGEYPTGLRLVALIASIFVSIFLVSLDRLIISTAIPKITDEFHSLQDVGWYGSAYMLTTCAFQLLFGKIYTFYPIRVVFMISIVLFEAGSAICGAAPSSVAFILGRAVQGVGSAGIFSGTLVSIVYAVPLAKRPLYQGMFGAVFGVSSILGPLVGGAFTSNVTWRCINIPFGAVALLIIGFLLKVPDREETKLPWKSKLSQLDAPGTSVLVPGVVCLLLALQWGGVTYPWSNGRIVALLTLAGVLLISFVLVQAFMPETATVHPRIFKQRSIIAGFWATVCIGSQQTIFIYFLPIWFQAVMGVSAVDSGIRLLPLTLSMVVASIANGNFVARIGYYTPSMIIGSCLMIVGAGLLTTLQLDTSMPKWIGYQVLYGFGQGMCFQAPNLAAQTVLPKKDVPIGTSLMFFSQILGGAIFVSVGQNVLNNQLLQRLRGLPGFEPSMIEQNGATTLSSTLPPDLLHPVLVQYNEALREVFRVGLILACLVIIGAVSMEFRSVKKKQPGSTQAGDSEKGATRDGDDRPDADGAARSDGGTIVEGSMDMEKKDGAGTVPAR
ncbi:Uu.00g092400.m01.CDS01 [Anthostomella pinea]|uniref:Uu.00g092400.m01.CDS01 n=1 Tax=Anthostomella pinea TaxID=933095 RepID=A0AAI8YI23_9PEZI|nr:Uu.00g092400.m01.CDS01 [Anthostomella pinea]